MYCQACGAENTEDARFCNMCGSRFAQAGEAGGPIAGAAAASGGEPPPTAGGPRNDPNATVLGVGKAEVAAATAPPGGVPGGVAPGAVASGISGSQQQSPFGGDSMLGVTLGGIGVQSAKKAWITVLAVAAFLVAAGALATWLAMRGTEEGGGHAEADDPFVLGMPLTEETERVPEEAAEGDPTPEDIDFVTGRSGSTSSSAMDRAPSTMRSGSTGGSTSTMRGSSSTGSTMTGSNSGGSSTGGSSTGSTTGGSSAGGTGGSSAGSTGGSTGGATMEEPSGGSSTMEGEGSTGGSGSLPTNTDSAPEERDLELELYGSRVRYVVRRYYAARAQNCFDRATRNDPHVSGTVVVAMTIGAEGEVTRARVQRNTTGNETLGSCLSNNVSTWRLPPPPGGSLDMTMPFSR